MNRTLIPRNYMANLTYDCGSAREFVEGDGVTVKLINMTCQWNKEWTPTHQLPECDWIACLKPPLPPPSTNLRITDWDSKPIPFGGTARYVCERGYFFEDDPEQIDQKPIPFGGTAR